MFTPMTWDRALCLPPLGWRMVLRYAQAVENAGQSLWPRFSGVVIADAVKQVYAAMPSGGARQRVRVLVADGRSAKEHAAQD